VGLLITGVGVIVSKKREAVGFNISLAGAILAFAALTTYASYLLSIWNIKNQPTHESLVVRNQELDDELEAISKYIDDVVNYICRRP
jgi:hypothetical protein